MGIITSTRHRDLYESMVCIKWVESSNIRRGVMQPAMHEDEYKELLKYLTQQPKSPLYTLEQSFQQNVITNVLPLITTVGYPSIYQFLQDILDIDITSVEHDYTVELLNHLFLPLSLTHKPSTYTTPYCLQVTRKYPDDMIIFRRVFNLNLNISTIEVVSTCIVPNTPSRYKATYYPLVYPILSEIQNRLSSILASIDTQLACGMLSNGDIEDIIIPIADNSVEYLTTEAKLFELYTQNTFMENMKIFLDNHTPVHEMFTMIKLLLFGNQENQNVAFLLVDMARDKKKAYINTSLFVLIFQNLSFKMQSLIEKGSDNMMTEMKRIKEMSLLDVDLKDQVLMHRTMPPAIKAAVLQKVEEMKTPSTEYYKQHLYATTLIKYPWTSNICDEDDPIARVKQLGQQELERYIKGVRESLDRMIYGHEDTKQLVLYFLGKWLVNQKSSGGCMSLMGPPGVGKTLFAQSISSAFGIPMAQITLGGQNDGELLHGHGYTYSGSSPGLIVKKMVEAGKSRCILFFDELDKCSSRNGCINEIMSVLIHLTDPNMNMHFQDRFFQGIDFHLGRAFIILSYNDASNIDPILLDRLMQIDVRAFTYPEKLHIAKSYLIPDICRETGMEQNKTYIDDDIISHIVHEYTNEAGVRGLKKCTEKLLLHLNLHNLLNANDQLVLDTCDKVDTILNMNKVSRHIVSDKYLVGVINCLYTTPLGSSGTCVIQISPNHSTIDIESKGITVTGSVGSIMKESITCAYSAALQYLYENKTKYNINVVGDHIRSMFPYGFHVHVLDAAQKKEGPSAGAAFALCFISVITGNKLPNNVAISAEIDVLGNLRAVGGIQQKLEGARLSQIKTVYLSKQNELCYRKAVNSNSELVNPDNLVVKLYSDLHTLGRDIFA